MSDERRAMEGFRDVPADDEGRLMESPDDFDPDEPAYVMGDESIGPPMQSDPAHGGYPDPESSDKPSREELAAWLMLHTEGRRAYPPSHTWYAFAAAHLRVTQQAPRPTYQCQGCGLFTWWSKPVVETHPCPNCGKVGYWTGSFVWPPAGEDDAISGQAGLAGGDDQRPPDSEPDPADHSHPEGEAGDVPSRRRPTRSERDDRPEPVAWRKRKPHSVVGGTMGYWTLHLTEPKCFHGDEVEALVPVGMDDVT